MMWVCLAAAGVDNLAFIESTMNKMDYLNILKNNLHSSVQQLNLGQSWVFQKDNDPTHSKKCERMDALSRPQAI